MRRSDSPESTSPVRAVVCLHVPDSVFGAVRMGYGRLQARMAAAGHSLEILTPERFPWVSRPHPRVAVVLYPLAVAWYLWRRRSAYDIALFHSYAGWVFHLAKGRTRTMTVFHGIETLQFQALDADHRAQGRRLSWRFRVTHGWLMDRWLAWSSRRSDWVTCLNSEEQRFLLDRGWATESRLSLLRHGVPDGFFVDDRVYAPQATRILFVSQWVERKGLRFLVSAFTELARRRPDVQLWCVGTRNGDERVLADFPEDVRSRVTNVPTITQDEVTGWYQRADLFVHTAINEAYGRAIAEAMAGGLPIVCTPVGVARELLRDGESVLTVPIGEPEAVVAAIERLADDQALRTRLGRGARAAAATLRASSRDNQMFELIVATARRRSDR